MSCASTETTDATSTPASTGRLAHSGTSSATKVSVPASSRPQAVGIVVAAKMPISEEIQRIILANGNAMEIADQARREGVADLRESGLRKVKAGLTSIEEVLGVTNVS